jgi:hypothetical protein
MGFLDLRKESACMYIVLDLSYVFEFKVGDTIFLVKTMMLRLGVLIIDNVCIYLWK